MVSRKASRQVPRRVPEPRMVPLPRPSKGDHRSMAAAQRSAAAFESQLSHAQRVRGARCKTSAPSGNGPDVTVHGDSVPCPRVTGRTLRYMGTPRPGLSRDRHVGTRCSQRGRPSQANRGAKNQDRPRFTSSVTTFILWTEEKSPASGSGWIRVRNCSAGWSHQGILRVHGEPLMGTVRQANS